MEIFGLATTIAQYNGFSSTPQKKRTDVLQAIVYALRATEASSILSDVLIIL